MPTTQQATRKKKHNTKEFLKNSSFQLLLPSDCRQREETAGEVKQILRVHDDLQD